MSASTSLIVSFLIPDSGTTSNWRIDSTFTNYSGGIWFSGTKAGTITLPNTSFNGGNLIGYFRMLQGQGKKVLVSMGGATFDLINAIPNVTVATNLADSINFALFGASTPSNGWSGVIGDAPSTTPFIFDGIDLDFEQESTADINVMTTFVSRLRQNLPAGKTLECAPEIPYFRSGFPKAFNGNGEAYPYTNFNDRLSSLNTTSTNTLFSVNNIGLFDNILIQFYNQSNDQYPGPSPTYGSSFPYILSQAAYLCLSSTTPGRPKPKIAIGLVSDSSRSYGSPNPWPSASTIALPLWQGILDAQQIIVTQRPGTVITDWLHGLMSWDSPLGQTYLSAIIATPSISIPNNQYLYGGQNYSIPVTLANPGWDSIPYASTPTNPTIYYYNSIGDASSNINYIGYSSNSFTIGSNIYDSSNNPLSSLTYTSWKIYSPTPGNTAYDNGNILPSLTGNSYKLYPNVPCFLEGSKIRCLVDGKQKDIPIELIRKGTLVETALNGYKKVERIGYCIVYNPRTVERAEDSLYRCSTEKYPELTEDLILTGHHSILVDHITDYQRAELIKKLGDVYITGNKYRLIACLDDRAEPWGESKEYKVWHLALENTDLYTNYGIFANGGLLVETMSLISSMKKTNIKIIE
jgi:hypothetical protein